MTQSNSRLLYDKLNLRYITENMVGQEFENNWLECKEKSRANHGGLDDEDKKYFAKALSGFANTSGGVLLFGLEARKKDDIDQIQSIKPIQQLKRFEAALRDQESRLVERLVPGVEYKAIKTTDDQTDEGIIAILIPESPYLPHRSLRDKEFYLRAGGVFSSLPLTLVEDLVFRRSKPKLSIHFRRQFSSHFNVSLRNDGNTSARWPHIALSYSGAIKHSGYELDGFTRLHTWHQAIEYREVRGAWLIFTNGANIVVHPGTEIPMLRIDISPNASASNEVAKFRYYLSAENMATVEKEVSVNF